LKRSTTPLIDQNVSNEEAQGINGKTPAKHSAASPKPQGMGFVCLFVFDQVGCFVIDEAYPEE